MSKNFQEGSDPALAAASDLPPRLPDAAYRVRVRGVLQKYRRLHKLGWDRIIKDGMLPLLSPGQIDAHRQTFHLDTLRRRLIRFCDEKNGDLKEPRTFSLLESFLERAAPELMGRVLSRHVLLRLGRTFSSFLTVPAEARLHRITERIPGFVPLYQSGIAPGVYALCDDIFTLRGKPATRFLVLTDIGDNDFLFAQLLTVRWSSPSSTELMLLLRFSGFLFPFALDATLMLRSVETNHNDISSVFVVPSGLPEQLQTKPGYACSLTAAGLHLEPGRRLREHVFRSDDLDPSTQVIANLAEHRMWDL